jgi:hypothetical protein
MTVVFDNNAQFLELTINGQPGNIPSGAAGKITITKDNYRDFLR